MHGCNFLIRGGFNEITILKREIIYLIFWDRRINVLWRCFAQTRRAHLARFAVSHFSGTPIGGDVEKMAIKTGKIRSYGNNFKLQF